MTTAQEDWEGPMRGDDKDKRFLVDYVSSDDEPRTGRARLDDSEDNWSPANDRWFTLKPTLDQWQQEREEQRQNDAQEAAEWSRCQGQRCLCVGTHAR